MQAEPISVIKLDASSREAGALKAEAIVHYASALIFQFLNFFGHRRNDFKQITGNTQICF
jgi:hypothetical protein